MGNHGFNNRAGIGRRIGHEIDNAFGQASFLKGFDNQAVGCRAQLRTFHDHGVAAGQGYGNGAGTQNDGRVPGGHAQYDAGGLAHGHSQIAWYVGGNDFAIDLGGQCRGLDQHVCGQMHVESGPHG